MQSPKSIFNDNALSHSRLTMKDLRSRAITRFAKKKPKIKGGRKTTSLDNSLNMLAAKNQYNKEKRLAKSRENDEMVVFIREN